MPDIALGFVNTVDYEAVWDPAALETLIASSCVSPADIGPKARIRTLRDLLGSTLWHFAEGTGCGQYVEDPAALDACWTSCVAGQPWAARRYGPPWPWIGWA